MAGGQESMSLSPHCMHLRSGTKMGDTQMIDTMIRDGLWDAFNGYHMGITAENVAEKWQITREQQDKFATASQNKAEAAQKAGKFKDEIVPVIISGRKGDVTVADDEYIKAGTNIEILAKLRPAFKKDGTVTAGNASGLNDGAAALILMSAENAAKRGLKPLARIASWATAGVDPAIMGSGPIPASRKALERAGWKVSDLDLMRPTRRFAAQACAVQQGPRLGYLQGQRQWRRHRPRPSDRRVGCPRVGDAAAQMQKWNAKKGLATYLARRRGRPHRRAGERALSQGRCQMARVAVVTGGTRGHRGGHLGRVEAKHGYKVAANHGGNDTAAEAFSQKYGILVQIRRRRLQAVPGCGIKKITAELGPVDIVVTNAGITRDGHLVQDDAGDVGAGHGDQPRVCFNMSRAVIEGMRERGFGRIVNIGSINGQAGQYGQVNYAAAKSGIHGFTKALAQEGAAKNITVNAIAPGYIDTDMVRAVPPQVLEKIVAKIPVGRLGRAEEIARGVLFLVADDAGFITGSTLSINGGQHMY